MVRCPIVLTPTSYRRAGVSGHASVNSRRRYGSLVGGKSIAPLRPKSPIRSTWSPHRGSRATKMIRQHVGCARRQALRPHGPYPRSPGHPRRCRDWLAGRRAESRATDRHRRSRPAFGSPRRHPTPSRLPGTPRRTMSPSSATSSRSTNCARASRRRPPQFANCLVVTARRYVSSPTTPRTTTRPSHRRSRRLLPARTSGRLRRQTASARRRRRRTRPWSRGGRRVTTSESSGTASTRTAC